MTEYKDDDNNNLCDWCGGEDHAPAHCLDILDKSIGTFKRAATKSRKVVDDGLEEED